MSHENAPATKMLATACACCGRDLVDAVSVETGIGPECRKKYAIENEQSEEARREANQIVFQLAHKGLGRRAYLPAIDRLAELGFVVLAERVAKRFRTTVSPTLSDAEVTKLRAEYRKLRTDFCYDNGFDASDFDAAVVSQGPRSPRDFVALAAGVTCMCKRCGGSGQYVRHDRGGNAVSTSECFRCGGKGHQDLDDARRNRAYDEHALNRALRAG